jgi:hypothetical protein
MPDLASAKSIAGRLATITSVKSDMISSTTSSRTTKGNSSGGRHSKILHLSNSNAYTPWAEQYKSINAENRLRLHCTIIVLRMIENVFVCLFLPQTPLGCRVTSHCESSSVIWGNPIILKEKSSSVKYSFVYDALPHDFLSNLTISLSIATVTALLLWAQALALDKSYLSLPIPKQTSSTYYTDVYGSNTTMGTSLLSSGGNDSAINKLNSHNQITSSGGGAGGSNKRRNKGKGSGGDFCGSSDNVIHSSNGNLNNSDKYTRAMHDIFQYELCHFSQSTVLVIITKIQILCIIFVSIVCAYRFLTSLNFLAASVTLFGNVVAVFAMSGPTETLELEQIAEEIRGHIDMDDNKKLK